MREERKQVERGREGLKIQEKQNTKRATWST